jgi:predicted transposase YdaD
MGQYDITTKTLIENHTADWLAMAGLPVHGPVAVVDADLATVQSVPDKLIRVGSGALEYIAQIDLQASVDPDLDRRMLMYNVSAGWRHRLDVRTVVFLMRPEAESARVTGSFRRIPDDRSRLEFVYPIIRVWDLPVDQVLAAGIGTLPLAPISAVSQADLPRVIDRMRQRLDAEVAPEKAAELWTATDILLGLRYSESFAEALLAGVQVMEESTTYQAILRKGEARGVVLGEARGVVLGEARGEALGRLRTQRSTLVRLGTARFGPPPEAVVGRINQLNDPQLLDDMLVAVVSATGWDAVMQVAR